MSPERLPSVSHFGKKTTAKASQSSPASQRCQLATRQKPKQHQTFSTSHPQTGPAPILLSNSTVTPWGALALSASSFASITPAPPLRPPPPLPPPTLPPAPQPTPSTPYRNRLQEDEDSSSTSLSSDAQSPPLAVPQSNTTVDMGKGLRMKRRSLPQHGHPRPPRLPPLRPVTNLSFSRSFTFSFFELPLDQSPRCRAERAKNLLLLLKQIHY